MEPPASELIFLTKGWEYLVTGTLVKWGCLFFLNLRGTWRKERDPYCVLAGLGLFALSMSPWERAMVSDPAPWEVAAGVEKRFAMRVGNARRWPRA